MLKYVPRIIAKRLFVAYALLNRAMTLGVRVVVHNDSEVLLVRHTYVHGWHLPGGGVERGETFQDAVIKEVMEEAAIEITASPQYFHVYLNPKNSRFDHVALYVCSEWQQNDDWKPDSEIAEIGFFPINSLPEGTTPSTRLRLKEVFEGQTPDDSW